MSEIKIDRISVIKLEPGEKLLVRLPEGSSKEEFDQTRESILKFFNIMPDKLLLYAGEVEFKKVRS